MAPHLVLLIAYSAVLLSTGTDGPYDLLLAKQTEVETEKAHLEAWRGYWIARARLERALGGSLPAEPATAAAADQEGR